MHIDNPIQRKIQPTTLRAMIEIIAGELKIYPVAESDADEKLILDALRFLRGQAA